MSKVDQLRALGSAKAARKNTPEASGTARIEEHDGKRRSGKTARSQSGLLPPQCGARITSKPSKEPKADNLGKVVSSGISAGAPVRGLRREGPDSSGVRSPQSEAEVIHDGGGTTRQEATGSRKAGSGKVRHTMRKLPPQAHLSAKGERGNTVRTTNTNPVAPSGLSLGKPKRGSARASTIAKVGDGVALTSVAHPPGLIDKIAGAIRSGKLKVSPPNPVAKATKGKAVPAGKAKGSCKTPVTPADGVASRLGAGRTAQDSPRLETAGAVAIQKRGRPRLGETRDKPWLKCKPPMSERTWYRRKREAEKAK